MSIKPIFAWYDLWIGAYWNRKSRTLYILPIPCVGVVISFERDNIERSKRASCKMIGLAGRLTPRDLRDMADYCKTMYEAPPFETGAKP